MSDANAQRVNRGRFVLQHYSATFECDAETALRDLLADLMHAATLPQFGRELARANRQVNAEQGDDPWEAPSDREAWSNVRWAIARIGRPELTDDQLIHDLLGEGGIYQRIGKLLERKDPA